MLRIEDTHTTRISAGVDGRPNRTDEHNPAIAKRDPHTRGGGHENFGKLPEIAKRLKITEKLFASSTFNYHQMIRNSFLNSKQKKPNKAAEHLLSERFRIEKVEKS